MRKKSTRLLSAALAVCMMLSVLPVGAFAAGTDTEADAAVPEEGIAINEENFPNPDFRDNVWWAWNTNHDNRFSPSEIAAAKWISCENNSSINSLKGIEFFKEIYRLDCYYDNLTTIDLSNNKKLEYINCIYNKLEELDVSELPLLETFACDGNKLQSIDVSENKKLKDFSCKDNPLGTLNVSKNTGLERLVCANNNLTELDVSENKKLKTLGCYENKLRNLNLGNQTELEWLSCGTNPLSVLDVSANTKLKELYVSKTNLTELNVSANTDLETLFASETNLTELNISANTKLKNLDVSNTNLTSLDAKNNTALEKFKGKNCSYNIAVEGDGKFDLTTLPGHFDASKATATGGGTINENENILTVDPNSQTFRYDYDIGQPNKKMNVVLNVHWHNYQWKHDGTKHWRECTTANCPGLTAEQVAKTTHDYTDAKDNDCNTCGYVRPLYTVTTGENVTAKLEDEVLNAPVAAGTKVTLTAGDTPEGKTFHGWKLYKVENGTETEIIDEAELAKLLENGTATTATLTMPAYNVKAEPYYSNIPYNIMAVDCTVDKTEAPMGDTVTATRREPEANERFTGWTVTVNGVKQPDDFLTPDANDPAKVRFTMPAENVEIKANFEGNPTLNIGDHVTANIDGSDASVPSGSTVPVDATVHLTAIAPDGQHFTGWTVKVGDEEQKADTFLTPDKNDPTKATFIMPDANVEVTATFADDSIPEPDPVGPSDTGNIQGAISAVVVGAAAGVIAYEAGTGIYRVINMPGIPMPSNRIELAELLWEHAGKPEPVSTALYSDIDEGDTDAQKAARWAVEQDLMKDDADNNKFHPAFPVSKLRTCLTWNAAKEKGLFDKTEE